MISKKKKAPVAQQLIDSLLDELPLLSKKKATREQNRLIAETRRMDARPRDLEIDPDIKVDNEIVLEDGQKITVADSSVSEFKIPAESAREKKLAGRLDPFTTPRDPHKGALNFELSELYSGALADEGEHGKLEQSPGDAETRTLARPSKNQPSSGLSSTNKYPSQENQLDETQALPKAKGAKTTSVVLPIDQSYSLPAAPSAPMNDEQTGLTAQLRRQLASEIEVHLEPPSDPLPNEHVDLPVYRHYSTAPFPSHEIDIREEDLGNEAGAAIHPHVTGLSLVPNSSELALEELLHPEVRTGDSGSNEHEHHSNLKLEEHDQLQSAEVPKTMTFAPAVIDMPSAILSEQHLHSLQDSSLDLESEVRAEVTSALPAQPEEIYEHRSESHVDHGPSHLHAEQVESDPSPTASMFIEPVQEAPAPDPKVSTPSREIKPKLEQLVPVKGTSDHASPLPLERTVPLIRKPFNEVEELKNLKLQNGDAAGESSIEGLGGASHAPSRLDPSLQGPLQGSLQTIDRMMVTEIRPSVIRKSASEPIVVRPKVKSQGATIPTFSSAEASLKQSESLRIAQTRISDLETELDRLRRENERLASAGETIRRHSDELRSRLDYIEQDKRESERILEEEKRVMRGQLNQKDRENVELRNRVDETEGRLESNFKKIRVRERELEHRLEIMKMESATLVSTKDKMILDLKRQVDQLTHEAEFGKQKSQELFNQFKGKQDTIRRVVRALRIALTILEGDEENVVPIKKAE